MEDSNYKGPRDDWYKKNQAQVEADLKGSYRTMGLFRLIAEEGLLRGLKLWVRSRVEQRIR